MNLRLAHEHAVLIGPRESDKLRDGAYVAITGL